MEIGENRELNIDEPVGNYRYIVCVQRGVIDNDPKNVFSIIPISQDKPQDPKAQHFTDQTRSNKWRKAGWPTINAIDYATYIQQADSITTYTTDRQEAIDIEVLKVDDKPRLRVYFPTISGGGSDDVVPDVDGAYVLLDTKN